MEDSSVVDEKDVFFIKIVSTNIKNNYIRIKTTLPTDAVCSLTCV